MLLTREARFHQALGQFPSRYNLRYTEQARYDLLQTLFRFLVGENEEVLQQLFGGRLPRSNEAWSLSDCQGKNEDMEYTEAARGKPCGHIYKSGDSIFRCKTCASDDTAVLCTRCFEASDHTGHIVSQNISMGNSGCCDCGDEEAWKLPVRCAIHSADGVTVAQVEDSPALPRDLLQSVRMTIGRSMDYLIDVISCSPENLRLLKTEESIRLDENVSRMESAWYDEVVVLDPEYALVIWNDEKHTISEVEDIVKRACKQRSAFGNQKANEANEYGRSVVLHSSNISHLLSVAAIIEQIKVTVTIRSSRDTFREQMCGTIVEFFNDIAACSLLGDHDVLRHSICDQMLRQWQPGSSGSNRGIGENGLDDHASDDFLEESIHIPGENVILRLNRRQPRRNSGSDSASNNEDEDDDGYESSHQVLVDEEEDIDSMEIDGASDMTPRPTQDVHLSAPSDMDTGAEMSEATFAGYPPPPPPVPGPSFQGRIPGATNVVRAGPDITQRTTFVSRTNIEIPLAPKIPRKRARLSTPQYWLEEPQQSPRTSPLPLEEDLERRIRLDLFLLYDLRLWKRIRNSLRDLYITTILSDSKTRRIFGLRFAALYSVLGQLYLIADREPDLSVINLSVQIFTVPSVTRDIIDRANFLTTLFSMLYTFLTQRTVLEPWQISVDDAMASENNSVSNRRMFHFFYDLKHMFWSEYVQKEIHTQERYQLQFLDLIRLPQGICPNVRAVGEHVEYENDIWIAAQFLTKEINKLIRQVAETFRELNGESSHFLHAFIRSAAKAVIVNSMGGERVRFDQAEIKFETRYKTLEPFHFERSANLSTSHVVVDFVVEREAISFHHPLHNLLSWLVECGKSLDILHLRGLLTFTLQDLRRSPPFKVLLPDHRAEDYLMAAWDFPLRVCVWLAQMRAGMWVRNGLSLRHQMTTYRGLAHRDMAHHRDIFLLQTAMVTCDQSRVLASAVDRFGMDQWMRGDFSIRESMESTQQIDIAEDFVHLLIVLMCDRTSLCVFDDVESARTAEMRRDLAHILCFKPLSFSELDQRFADKSSDLEEFQDVLDEMTIFKPPEGLSDTGSFELKGEYLSHVDPYAAHYTRNQRDEAENACRTWMSKMSGKPLSEVVFEPRLRTIEKGIFVTLPKFVREPLFAQIIFYSLFLGLSTHRLPDIPATRVDAYLHVVLHLTLVAVRADRELVESSTEFPAEAQPSFTLNLLRTRSDLGLTIFDILVKLLEHQDYRHCHPQIRLILHRIKQAQPHEYRNALSRLLGASGDSVAETIDLELPMTPGEDEDDMRLREARLVKKKQALDRQAKVMAQFQQQQQNFINNQDVSDWEEVEDTMLSETHEEASKTWRFPSGNCILCQEETNDSRLYGTFGMTVTSSVFRQTDAQSQASLTEVLSTPQSLDKALPGGRPFGIAGSNQTKIVKRTSNGGEIEVNFQGLAKGFPIEFTSQGPISTGCGHIMHNRCFETYCKATQRRHSQQIARRHPERLDLKEFVCPLCKALGNTFLPIIWKGKKVLSPAALDQGSGFGTWLLSELGLNVTRSFKAQEGRSGNDRLQGSIDGYVNENIVPSLNQAFSREPPSQVSSPLSPPSSSRPAWLPNLTNTWRSLQDSPRSPSIVRAERSSLAVDLVSAYARLKQSLLINTSISQPEDAGEPGGNVGALMGSSTLFEILAQSISSLEIAHRGTDSLLGENLVERMPESAITYLHILSETASSVLALEVKTADNSQHPLQELSERSKGQLLQLFAGHPHIDIDVEGLRRMQIAPAILQDAFKLLVEATSALMPAFNIPPIHLLRLCYILEIVKASIYLTTTPQVITEVMDLEHSNLGPELLDIVSTYITQLLSWSLFDPLSSASSTVLDENAPHLRVGSRKRSLIYEALKRYALVFLRKATILFHVRFGLDLQDIRPLEADMSELDMLANVLHLPSLCDIFSSIGRGSGSASEEETLKSIIAGWINHWHLSQNHGPMFGQAMSPDHIYAMCSQSVYKTLRPGHPGVFELIGLPKHFDTLTYEATRHRCPTHKGKMEDPNLCLLCGAFFCGQALCCSKDDTGGCFQHMGKCGKNVGVFINIRKCTALYLHKRNGSWNLAPYLDKYGEPDPGLRRGRQLSLSQKRYDKMLRDVWLQQLIPTTIARKLEAEINNGGWETL